MKTEKKYKIPVTFAVIPSQVRFCREISSNAKLLYGDIVLLAHQDGYCRASNDYLAFIYNVDDKTISEWVSQLKKVGFIKVPQLKGYERHIYPQVGTFREKKQGQENTTLNTEKADIKSSGKADNNNTSINNIETTSLVESTQPEDIFSLEDEIQRLLNYEGDKFYFLRIIGIFIKRKKPDIRNKKQFNKFVKDYTWCAKQLEIYDNDQIIRAIKEAEQMVDSKTGQQWDWDLKNVISKIKKLKK